MKTMLWKVSFIFLLSALVTVAAPRSEQWKKVEDAVNKGLPKTAIAALEPIIKDALAEKKYGEAVKAIGKKIALEGNIQGNKPEEKITRIEQEIAQSPAEIKPLLTTLQAHWYWHYFQQNKWRFMRRTTTAEAPGKDFTTWDLPRLFAEIDKKFTEALAAEKLLQSMRISDFDDLLQKGNMPDSYRPTLYDFIANEALQFYTSGEQAAAKPQDAFEVAADGEIFDSVEKFLAWKIQTDDTSSPVYQALQLYKSALHFHQADADQSAFLDLDLARLNYGRNIAFGEEKNGRFKQAMQRIAEANPKHELSSLAIFHWASVMQSEGHLAEARQLALRGAAAFPHSAGGRNCRAVVDSIETKSVNLATERIWNAPWPKISLHYRNVEQVFFRAVPADWGWFLQQQYGQPGYLDWDKRKELLGKKPVREWTEKLPTTADYKEHRHEVPAPENLPPGYYYIFASHRADFGEKENQVAMADVWVSDLAVVNRNRVGLFEGFVLQAGSGEPVSGAEISVWYYDRGKYVADAGFKTDENGFFSLKSPENRDYVFKVRHGEHELGSAQPQHSYHWNPGRNHHEQTVFFTDRAIYRPGQTIQFKGICLSVDQDSDKYEVIKGREVEVMFADANAKEIARLKQRCNDFGSFSGSFTAPRDRLMGQMQIHILTGPPGQTHFRVEEYKRPKFQVTLDAPKTAPRLNEKCALTGHAMAYTGAAIDGALVKYRVVRQVRWPWWWGWYGWWHRGPSRSNASQEIAHGTLKTEVDGNFKIEFIAKPDLSVAEKDEPTFVYQIYADVTDSAGETRSDDRTVNVGYTALQAMMSAEEWQEAGKPVAIKITTSTLDGEPQAAEGVVKLYELKAPEKVQRPRLDGGFHPYYAMEDGATDENEKPPLDLSNPNSWELGKVVTEKKFSTDKEGKTTLHFTQVAGAYRVVLATQDRFGQKVTGKLPLQILQPNAAKFPIRMPNFVAAKKYALEPGEELLALWGTGYEQGRAFVEIEHRHQMLQRYWTKPGRTQEAIKLAVTEAMRGGFTLHVTQVRENRGYLHSRRIDVPWSNKKLDIKWEHFTSKLQPGQKETWTAVISGSARVPRASDGVAPSGEKGKNKSDFKNISAGRLDEHAGGVRSLGSTERIAAEMVATLYDESLDQFVKPAWPGGFHFFRQDYSTLQSQFANQGEIFEPIWSSWGRAHGFESITYRHFPHDLTQNFWGYQFGGARYKGMRTMAGGAIPPAAAAVTDLAAPMEMEGRAEQKLMAKEEMSSGRPGKRKDSSREQANDAGSGTSGEPKEKGPDLSQVTARKNLNETAFFFPQLTSDSNGVVKMTFTMPEALTQWRFLGFAYDRNARSGFIDGKTVTAKDLMVQPNPPRFMREGDELEFTVKVSNQTDATQKGKVRLTFNDGVTDKSVDAKLGNNLPEQSFTIEARQSRSFSWRIKVPNGLGVVTYKAVGGTDKISDGEEGFVPVLSRRIFVTESLPLPIRGLTNRTFHFTKLLESGKSDTLKHQSLTVQMVSNPSWYAVMALPYLMEYPYECSEQIFNRLYANALARHIANSNEKIHKIFEQWRGTPALDSPLEKNQDLKSVLLEETPWVRQAADESQARRNVGLLFEDNRMNHELERSLQKLRDQQLDNGAWPWFPSGFANDYITLYITTGFGRLRHLGVALDMAPAIRSLQRLDGWMDHQYREILRNYSDPKKYVPSATDALYLYGRSFFLKDQKIAPPHQEAVEFFLQRSRDHWLQVNNRQSQGHLAIALQRFAAWQAKQDATPTDIMKSIKERSVTDEEMGMFWRELELSWWWFRAPIETQALMIEAFDEVMKDEQAVEDCKVWLLKQKQTQDWKTTKATADAVYALLLRGESQLASDALVEMKVGSQEIKPEKVEAGTGFYEERFTFEQIQPAMGEITVKKVDQGVAWGSVHWQYFEDMTKVTPHEGTPLKLKKTLYQKVTTKRGPELQPIKGALAVGDELVVRVELRTDRDMEYVHLKDQRGSGTEPVNVISQYKYQDGLAYYESTRDTASHFFIDYLPKGVYVFEYSTRVQLRGEYQSGMAEIQCLYAPEFNSHSESFKLVVK